MNKLAKQLFFTKQLDFGEEILTLMGERNILTHASAFTNLHAILREQKDGILHLYKAGSMTGERVGASILKKGLSGEKLWNFLCEVNKMSGWGNLKLVDFSTEKYRAIVQVENCAIDTNHDLKNSNCHFIRGIIAGNLKIVFGKGIDAIETKCATKGDGLCEFIVSPPEDFDLQSTFVQEQLPMPELIKIRKQKNLPIPPEIETRYAASL